MQKGNPISYLLFDSTSSQRIYKIFTGYITHFSPLWLFITGDNDRHHAPSTGLLYIWEAPFLLIGLWKLFVTKGKLKQTFFLWFLLAPLAASLTKELPHAVRTLIFLPSFQIATAVGIEASWLWVKMFSFVQRGFFILPVLFIAGFFVLQYFHLYFYQMNHELSHAWQFGFEHAVNYVEQNKSKYKRVVVSTDLEEAYMFFLFYLRFDPKVYLAHGGTKGGGVESFDMFTFRKIQWGKENHDGTTLYVLSPTEAYSHLVHMIRFFDSAPAIRFAE